VHRLHTFGGSKGPRKRQAKVPGRAECDMYVCDTTLHHLYPTTDRYERNISKIKATLNVYTHKQVTASQCPGVN